MRSANSLNFPSKLDLLISKSYTTPDYCNAYTIFKTVELLYLFPAILSYLMLKLFASISTKYLAASSLKPSTELRARA
jgi:hypothetical protein